MRIVLFIPYFGKLPQYLPAFIHSCSSLNGRFDILFFTDDLSIKELNLPENVHYEIWSFDKIKSLVEKILGCKLYSPYKLCDYKPCYGHLFEHYTEGYEYWGYCDVDVMFGDVVGYLDKIGYKNYDRIGSFGHLTLYKNTEANRYLYKKQFLHLGKTNTFDYVSKTTLPCNFDEGGMNVICKLAGLKFLENIPILNTSYGYKHLHSWSYREHYQLWCWSEGKVFSYHYDDNHVIRYEEAVYLHFMMHNLPIKGKLDSFIYVCDKGIFGGVKDLVGEYLIKYGEGDTSEEHLITMKSIKKRNKKIFMKRLIEEFRYCRFRAFVNLYDRTLSHLHL